MAGRSGEIRCEFAGIGLFGLMPLFRVQSNRNDYKIGQEGEGNHEELETIAAVIRACVGDARRLRSKG